MSSQVTEATNMQLYGPSAISLIFAVIAIIIALLAELNSISLKNLTPDNSITSINSSNGFAGTISNHTATLSTTINGLLSGKSGGKLEKATNNEIIQATMQNFQPNKKSTETSNITSSTSILEAIEKGCVLNQTKLGSTYVPQSGTITANDTLMTFFEQGQYSLNLRQKLFSAFGKGLVSPTRQLWQELPTYGSTILPIGFWTVGTAISIKSVFQWSTGSQSGIAQFTFSFNNESIVLNVSQPGLTFDKLTLTVVIVVQTPTLINVYMTAEMTGATKINQTATTKSQIITFDSGSITELGLKATISGTSNVLTFIYAAGTILFQS